MGSVVRSREECVGHNTIIPILQRSEGGPGQPSTDSRASKECGAEISIRSAHKKPIWPLESSPTQTGERGPIITNWVIYTQWLLCFMHADVFHDHFNVIEAPHRSSSWASDEAGARARRWVLCLLFLIILAWSQSGEMIDVKTEVACGKIQNISYIRQIVYCSCFY